MKKLIYSIMIIALIALQLPLCTVLAASNDTTTATKPNPPAKLIIVNAEPLAAEHTWYQSEQGNYMVPLRAIAEALKYEVTWNQAEKAVQVKKDDRWAFLRIGEDLYTASLKSPLTLGDAPALINNLTYVPSTFFTEVLSGFKVEVEGDTLKFSKKSGLPIADVYGKIDEIEKDWKTAYVTIILNGFDKADDDTTFILYIHSDTEIVDRTYGKPLTIDDLEEKQEVIAYYDLFTRTGTPPTVHTYKLIVEKYDDDENQGIKKKDKKKE